MRRGEILNEDLLPPLPETEAPRVRASPRIDRRDITIGPPPILNMRRHIQKATEDTEFVFGASIVEAALRSGKRDLYKLYIYAGRNRTPEAKRRDDKIKALARKLHPSLEIVDEPDLGQLDSMSNSRPHK